MGSNQSNTNYTARKIGDTVIIERAEIPEEYKNVRISREVVSRVINQDSQNINDQKENKEDGSESTNKGDTQKMRYDSTDKMNINKKNISISENDIEAKKAVFKNAAKRVDDRFFKFQRGNECSQNEDTIIACLSANKNTPWNCSTLVQEYDNCITSFLQKVSATQ
uniref:CHCH domain-containing protein n=1 Tax=Strongyloides venezuelensis TaxID=75913 RepID=A0A0K0F9A6_STRVS